MSFVKKILLGGTLIATVIPATIVLVSCSNKAEPFDIGISEKTEKYYGEKITAMTATNPEVLKRKTMLITAGGKVNDKSFNESAWGALQLFEKQANIKGENIFTFRETTDDAELPKYYDEAINGGFKTLILTGFQQGLTFKNWLSSGSNRTKFEESQAVVIGVDWDGTKIIPEGQFFGLGFKTNEASWIIGQAASEFLTASGKKPHLSSFGGGTSDGVTDFNNGFLQGMLDWNKTKEAKVKFYSGNSQADTIDLSTGFDPNNAAIETIKKIVGTTEEAPQIILPVAGSLTASVLENIKEKRSSQMIIGVDSNQALAFPNDKERFFSSVEKKVAVAVYKALILLVGINLDFVDDAGIKDEGFQGKFVVVGKPGAANAFVKYGFDKGFVGFSPSTLKGDDAVIANKALETANALFKSTPPTFESMSDDKQNQTILDGIIKELNSITVK